MLNHPELLDRLFQPSAGTFPKELARQILELHYPPEDHARYEQLSHKAQDATLMPEERAQFEDYLKLNDFLSILKAKAEASAGAGCADPRADV
jgi:hypothetical protein